MKRVLHLAPFAIAIACRGPIQPQARVSPIEARAASSAVPANAASTAEAAPQVAALPTAEPPTTATAAAAQNKPKYLPFGPLKAAEPSGPRIDATPPDPVPLSAREFVVFDLTYDKGSILLGSVSTETFDAAQTTPRSFGRFALELFQGAQLIERMRFNFPLLGAGLPEGKQVAFERITTRIGVRFPRVARGTRLELVDRASGQRYSLPWPAP